MSDKRHVCNVAQGVLSVRDQQCDSLHLDLRAYHIQPDTVGAAITTFNFKGVMMLY